MQSVHITNFGLKKERMRMRVTLAVAGLLISGTALFGEVKVDRNVAYGPHERNVMDVYWNTEFKNAPIVFTIHGGAFKKGSKDYCTPDTQKLYLDKGCVVVSPNYRLLKEGTSVTIQDCEIDCASAVAYIQANARRYGGDPGKIVSTGGSAGGYLSALIAYRKKWAWPPDATYKPKTLNVIGWYGDSPHISPHIISAVEKRDPPAFMIYGEREHPGTPAKMGHDMHAALKAKGIWSQMVYVENDGHTPGKKVLIDSRQRDKAVFTDFSEFLDMVCYSKAKPKGGDVITLTRKTKGKKRK